MSTVDMRRTRADEANGVKQIKSPTEVHALQDQLKIYPLSSFGKPYTPGGGLVGHARIDGPGCLSSS